MNAQSVTSGEKTFRSDRHPAETYEEILASDLRGGADYLREGPVPDIGTDAIEVARYIDPAFARLEEKHLWPKVWQMVCREEEIPQPGDTHVYEIASRSLLIVRQKDGDIRAFHNSCLHRGRKLATHGGCKNEFRCPYHALAWNIDGTFKDNPIAWDFPQWADKDVSLPEARVGTWGGFVFINMDPEAPSLMEVLGPIPEHFAKFDFENRYISMHVQKIVPSNWKVTAEAFMESHHAIITHPQLLPYLADVNSQYDIMTDYVSRQFSAQMVPSPYNDREFTPDEIVAAIMGNGSRAGASGETGIHVPEGVSARAFMADFTRNLMSAEDGHDYSDAADAEMLDALLYNVFPHMSFWAGFMPNLFYRWRPNGRDHASSIMDIYILKPVPKDKPRPRPAPVFQIGIDESMVELGPKGGMMLGLAAVFEQDMANLPHVQTGLEASATGVVHLTRYSELRIRWMNQMIDRFIAEGQAKEG